MIINKEINVVNDKSEVEIKDGKIIYYNGEGSVKVEFNKELIIKVNGNTQVNELQLNANDVIDIELSMEHYKRLFNINISSDRLLCEISFDKSQMKKWAIKDCPRGSTIFLDFYITDLDLELQTFNMYINEVLKEKGIVYGIRWENIKEIYEKGSGIIAVGKKPEDPIDDEIYYYFGEPKNKIMDKNIEKIDYFNQFNEIEFVEEGKILAIVKQGVEGKIGFDIFGKPINPRKRVIKKIKQGPGSEVLESGKKVIAKISGMPRIVNEAVCVYSTYLIKEDVDYKKGNIEFHGNIQVEGNVCEGIKIVSGNQIIVKGNVTQAELYADSDISIKGNVIGSKIVVGSNNVNKQLVKKFYETAISYLAKLLELVKEVCRSNPEGVQNKLSQLIKVLIFSKLNDYKCNLSDAYNNLVKTPNIDKKHMNDINLVYLHIKEIELKGDINNIANILTNIKQLLLEIDIELVPANIFVSYCQNTEIISTNDVEILNVGCYNTNIFAENSVVFKGEKCILRGGKIEAKKNIKAKEVGSTLGVTTILKTSKEGCIEANVAYQNTVLVFDEIIFKIEEPVKNLKAYINKGELYVEKFKL